MSSGTVPASQLPSCGKEGEYGLYVSVAQNRAWIDAVMSGQEEDNAITPDCISAGTCVGAGSGGGSSSLDARTYYYIVIACIAVFVLGTMFLLYVIRNCRRRALLSNARRARNEERESSFVMHEYAEPSPPRQPVQAQHAPPPTPPPVYQQPVYQTPSPQSMYSPSAPQPGYNPEAAGQEPNFYEPDVYVYGAPAPAPPAAAPHPDAPYHVNQNNI